jgi:glucose/mannose-6-phosphate isomerase
MPGHDEPPALPEHLEDALWRVESARLQPAPAAGVLFCGPGAAQQGAKLAVAALDGRLTGPLLVAAAGRLPPEVDSDWSVICASFSGEDAEALACFEAAGEIGARRLAVGTGGRLVERAREEGVAVVGLPAIVAPDASFGYFFVAAAEAAALAGVAPRIGSEIRVAAAFLREHAEELAAADGPPGAEADSETARVLLAAMLGGPDGAG